MRRTRGNPPDRVPGEFRQVDCQAFEDNFRYLDEPVEIVRWGVLVGIYIPVRPRPLPAKRRAALAGTNARTRNLPLAERGKYTGQRAPKRGTAAYRRLRPYLDALDEAEGNERALLKAAHDYKKPEDT